jgi:hypothetical protein
MCFLSISVFATLAAGTTEVNTRAVGHCVREFDVGRALLNETLHEQVYYWANNHDVRDWQWEKTTASPELLVRWDVSAAEAQNLECVGIRYAAGIRIPEPFESVLVMWHMAVEIPLRVEKVVCRGNHVMYEDAVIHEPVLDQIQMSTKHVLVTDFDMESQAKTTLSLPWYAAMLEGQVKAAMDRSVSEKFDAVVRSLCEPRRHELLGLRSKRRNLSSWWKGLRPAPHPYAGPTDNATNTNASITETAGRHRLPHRPHRPANASDTWVVVLLPEEPWPAPEDEAWPCPDAAPCEKPMENDTEIEQNKKSPIYEVIHQPRLAVRRRGALDAKPQLPR